MESPQLVLVVFLSTDVEYDLTQATIQFYKKEAYDKIQEYLEIYASK